MKAKHPILIVDDDVDDQEIMRDAFGSATEQECIFIENGQKLMDYLNGHADKTLPSLVLLDLNMPGKDGKETLKEIKANKHFAQVPVIVFTTSSSHRDKKISYELGANCFISKPDTFNKMVELAKCICKLWLS
jgi:CheY-like chemotaxis protein